MATTTYGSPYVANTDLVSAWPGVSLNVAQRVDAVSYAGNGVNAQTGTTYTLVLTDAGKNVTLSNASSVTVTIPASGSVNYPTGTRINFTNLGAGTVTIAASGGVTLNGSPLTLSQYTDGSILKLATDTWVFTSAPVATSPGLSLITPTSIANSGGSASASGGAVTFTGVTSVSLNGVFSATSRNYVVVLNITASTSNSILMRLRASGTDATGANTYKQWIWRVYGTAPATQALYTDIAYWQLGAAASGDPSHAVWTTDIYNPFVALPTEMMTSGTYFDGTNRFADWRGSYHGVSSSYDGLTIYTDSGSIGGVVRVYGLKD